MPQDSIDKAITRLLEIQTEEEQWGLYDPKTAFLLEDSPDGGRRTCGSPQLMHRIGLVLQSAIPVDRLDLTGRFPGQAAAVVIDWLEGQGHRVTGTDPMRGPVARLAIALRTVFNRPAFPKSGAVDTSTGGVTGGKGLWLAKAMLLKQQHPTRSDAAIAQEVGKHPSTLSRSKVYQRAAALSRSIPKDGHAIRDKKGLQSVEAHDTGRNLCGAASRVDSEVEYLDAKLDRETPTRNATRNAKQQQKR